MSIYCLEKWKKKNYFLEKKKINGWHGARSSQFFFFSFHKTFIILSINIKWIKFTPMTPLESITVDVSLLVITSVILSWLLHVENKNVFENVSTRAISRKKYVLSNFLRFFSRREFYSKFGKFLLYCASLKKNLQLKIICN